MDFLSTSLDFRYNFSQNHEKPDHLSSFEIVVKMNYLLLCWCLQVWIKIQMLLWFINLSLYFVLSFMYHLFIFPADFLLGYLSFSYWFVRSFHILRIFFCHCVENNFFGLLSLWLLLWYFVLFRSLIIWCSQIYQLC